MDQGRVVVGGTGDVLTYLVDTYCYSWRGLAGSSPKSRSSERAPPPRVRRKRRIDPQVRWSAQALGYTNVWMTASIPRSGSVARRVRRPSASRIGDPNSNVTDSIAAISGGNIGTWYSSAKSWTVSIQLAVLARPPFRKTAAIARRNKSWMSGNGRRCKKAVTTASRARNPAGTAVDAL